MLYQQRGHLARPRDLSHARDQRTSTAPIPAVAAPSATNHISRFMMAYTQLQLHGGDLAGRVRELRAPRPRVIGEKEAEELPPNAKVLRGVDPNDI
jgi:hypothetical protein